MRNKRKTGRWLLPVWLALPYAAGMGVAVWKYGSLLRHLVEVAIKMVVTK